MFVKKEKFDWNGNTTFIESKEIDPNSEPTFIDNTKNKPIEKKAKIPYQGREKIPSRKKICTIVSLNHFGPIPGIPVGTCWLKRYQVSEAGVHRPLVAGIHGRQRGGAYSIVLSGTYAEDKDFGEEFFYSGCGGGVTDPGKLISSQIRDQTLTRYNKALAISCNAPLNDQVGADAEDWRAGKPVRAIRSHKLKKHSIYAPNEGYRYDGIYKVVKYFPTIGQSGLLVWRYLLRRDDPEPAPWTEEGKRLILENNLQIIVRVLLNLLGEKNYLKTLKIIGNGLTSAVQGLIISSYTWLKNMPLKLMKTLRPDETDCVRKHSKPGNNEKFKRLSKKQLPENNGYQFPDMETLNRMIMEESVAETSYIQDDGVDIKPDLNKLPTTSQKKQTKKQNLNKLKLKKSGVKKQTKKQASKTKIKKTRVKTSKKQSYEYTGFQFSDMETCRKMMMQSEMGLSSTNFISKTGHIQSERVDMKQDLDQLATNALLEPPTKRNCKPKLNKSRARFTKTETYEYTCYQFPDMETCQKMLMESELDSLTPTPNPLAETDEIDYNEEEEMEIEPDIHFLQGNSSPESPRKSKPKSNRPRLALCEPVQSVPKLNISVSTVTSIKRKNGGVNCNKQRNTKKNGRNRVTSTAEPSKNQNQIDLIPLKKEEPYELPVKVEKFIDCDSLNKTIWEYCRKNFLKSEIDFMKIVKLMFTCRYCCRLVESPVTTPCSHNVCLECISNHFSKKMYSCPECHNFLGPIFRIKENKNLSNALENLFPGYNLKY